MPLDAIRARTLKRAEDGADQTYPEHVGKVPAVNIELPVISGPCKNEGNVLEICHTCNGNAWRHVRECDVHGKCTWGVVSDKVMSCAKCRVEKLGFVAGEG